MKSASYRETTIFRRENQGYFLWIRYMQIYKNIFLTFEILVKTQLLYSIKPFIYWYKTFSNMIKPFIYLYKIFSYMIKPFTYWLKTFSNMIIPFIYWYKTFNYMIKPFIYWYKMFSYMVKPFLNCYKTLNDLNFYLVRIKWKIYIFVKLVLKSRCK